MYGEFKDIKLKLEEINPEDPQIVEDKKDIFEEIVGHDSLKTIFKNTLTSNEQIHILLTGAPASSKSLFLEAIAANVKNSCLITNNSTGAGMIHTLYNNPDIEYLLIDELEKIGKIEQSVLLTLMENGRLIVTKATMMCNREQKVRIFATTNCVDKLAPEMRSRFLRFHTKPYTFAEFVMITTKIATNRFKRSQEFGEKVANTVWENGSKDVRDAIKVIKLCKNEDDIKSIMKALKEYSEFDNDPDI